jgi:peroxiredoxin
MAANMDALLRIVTRVIGADSIEQLTKKLTGSEEAATRLTKAGKLPEAVASSLEKGVGLSKVNGDSSMELPLAATYVINTSGKITYAFVDADYRNRAEPSAIVDALQSLRSSK